MKNNTMKITIFVLIINTFLLIANIIINNNNDNNDNNYIYTNNSTFTDTSDSSFVEGNKIDTYSIMNKLIGEYTYKGSLVDKEKNSSGENFNDEDAWKLGKMTEAKLVLSEDGFATAYYQNVRGSGESAKGPWYVFEDKIVIINNECTLRYQPEISDEIGYGNCTRLWVYTYEISGGTAIIKSSYGSSITNPITMNKAS